MDNVVTHGESPGNTENGWTPRLIISLVSMMLLLEVLAASYAMISMAIPAISKQFHTTQGAWMITAFLLVGAVTGPLLGKLADVYGKRNVLLISVALSVVGSLISAVAPSYSVLIVGRCLTGFLASAIFLSYSLIRDVFPPRTIALAVSVCTTGLGLIAIATPFLGGWLIDSSFGWRSLFWFFTITLAVFGVMILLSTPESTHRLRSKVDWVGAILLGAGIASVMVAISFGPTWGWTNSSTLAYLVVGIVLLVAWLISAAKIAEPLIDLRVLRRRPVYLTGIASSFAYGGSALLTVMVPMLIMTPKTLGLGYGFGVSAKGFGIFQAPNSIALILAGALTGFLMGRRVRPRVLLAVGLLIIAIGFLLLAMSHDNKLLIMVFMGVGGIGLGFAYSSVPNVIIEAVPPQLLATTSSVVNAMQSVISSILTLVVFTTLNNSYLAKFPPEVTKMMQGASFYTNTGFRVAFLIGMVGALIGALAAFIMPRRIERVEVPAAESQQEASVPAR